MKAAAAQAMKCPWLGLRSKEGCCLHWYTCLHDFPRAMAYGKSYLAYLLEDGILFGQYVRRKLRYRV